MNHADSMLNKLNHAYRICLTKTSMNLLRYATCFGIHNRKHQQNVFFFVLFYLHDHDIARKEV